MASKLIVFAFDSTTNLPKTGDAANLTAYVSKDFGSVTVLGDTSATEMDATNAKGYYLFDLAQGETNADTLLFSAKSATSNIVVVGAPATVFTYPNRFSTLVIDSAGLADANAVKVGPTGSGTAQTAADLAARIGAPVGASISADIAEIEGETDAIIATLGTPAGASIAADLAEIEAETDGIAAIPTSDVYGRLGAPAGASISADIAAVKTETAEIDAVTDQFAFTVANQVDVNVLKIGGTTQTGADVGGMVADTAADLDEIITTLGAAGAGLTALPAGTLTAGERSSVADALLDRADAIETGWTLRKILRIISAAVCGKVSGSPTAPVFRDVTDAKNRITGVADSSGNRTTSTLDGT